MTTHISAGIHFGPDDVSRKAYPASGDHPAFWVIKFGEQATLYFESVGQVDAVARRLAAVRAEMMAAAPPVINGDRHPTEAERKPDPYGPSPEVLAKMAARGMTELTAVSELWACWSSSSPGCSSWAACA